MSKSKMKKGLKISRYTHIFFYPDGLRLAYNTLTGSLIELKGKEGDRFEAILRENPRISSSKCRDYDALATSGFLVDFDINELNVVRELVRIGKLKKHFAGITILPTLGCNFRCPYCFEGHKKHLMNQKVQDALIKFVDKCLLPKSNGFSINWFGGEPLLGFSIIESLSLRFRKICYEAGLSCPTASIVTNGYLLTNDKVIQLMALGVKSAQVTLDGPPKVHNRRRPLSGGQGSFDRIIENLRHIPEGFDVSIRINVDADNKDSVFELLKLLFNEGIIPKATPYIANVESFSGKCRSSEWGFLSSEQFSQFKKELLLLR